MSEQNKQLVRRWFDEVWNQHKESSIDEMWDPAGKAYGYPDANSGLGREEFKANFRAWVGACGDLCVQIEDIVAEGNMVAVRWTFHMTHTGDGFGFPASGKAGRLEGSSFLVVEGNKILNGWNQTNFNALLAELQSPREEMPA
jgi:predicted ester cyclase